jgi:hypothetical protein
MTFKRTLATGEVSDGIGSTQRSVEVVMEFFIGESSCLYTASNQV